MASDDVVESGHMGVSKLKPTPATRQSLARTMGLHSDTRLKGAKARRVIVQLIKFPFSDMAGSRPPESCDVVIAWCASLQRR